MLMSIEIYTDGGCSRNPGPGGWAYVIVGNGEQKVFSGAEEHTTNNRMELRAVIQAMKAVNEHKEWKLGAITLFTDSQYVKRGISEWINTWEKNGWKTSARQPVKNQDLWKDLKAISKILDISWKWVKGHAGYEFNELCDARVQEEINRIRK